MKDEVINLTEDASNLINEFEDYMFDNAKDKYIIAKSILDEKKDTIETITDNIDEIDLDTTKTDLENIINSIKELQDQVETSNDESEPEIINNAAPQIDEEAETLETIDKAIDIIDNGLTNVLPEVEEELTPEEVETIDFPTENDEEVLDTSVVNEDIQAVNDFLQNNDFNIE